MKFVGFHKIRKENCNFVCARYNFLLYYLSIKMNVFLAFMKVKNNRNNSYNSHQ